MANKDYSKQYFKYSGKEYFFESFLYIKVVDSNKLDKNDLIISIDNNDIESFIYENKLNNLYLTGKIIFTDRYGMTDRFLEKQFSYCEIFFAKNKVKEDKSIIMSKLDDSEFFHHVFLIDNVKIITRLETSIKYEINLISVNFLKCAANVIYSNYDKEPEQIFDIVKKCIINSNLQIHKESFDMVKSDVKINYITTCNDNLFSTIKYLLHKLYYGNNFDNSLKFLIYDDTKDQYRLFDIKNQKTHFGLYSITISMMKSNTETLTEQEPNNLGSITQVPKHETLATLFENNFYEYNIKNNLLINNIVKSEKLATMYNSKIGGNYFKDKMFSIPFTELTYNKSGARWNNDFKIYNDMVDVLTKDNSLIINTTGNIFRKPGCYVWVSIDRRLKENAEERKVMENQEKRYKGFEGLWITSKIQHIIEPAKQKYRQNLSLMRNFTVDKKFYSG